MSWPIPERLSILRPNSPRPRSPRPNPTERVREAREMLGRERPGTRRRTEARTRPAVWRSSECAAFGEGERRPCDRSLLCESSPMPPLRASVAPRLVPPVTKDDARRLWRNCQVVTDSKVEMRLPREGYSAGERPCSRIRTQSPAAASRTSSAASRTVLRSGVSMAASISARSIARTLGSRAHRNAT